MVLPTLVALTLALVWLLSLAVVQTRVVDAARESARALARSEEPARAVELGARIAPADAHITTSESGGTVTVRVTAPVRGPGGLLAFLPDFEVDARAVAAKEEASW